MNASPPLSMLSQQIIPAPFKTSGTFKILTCVLLMYAVYAMGQLGFSIERLSRGMHNGAEFLGRMFPARFADNEQLLQGVAESLEMAVLSTFSGVLISLPIAVLGARNLMPTWVTWPVRFFITLCRAFNPVILGIIFIKAVGFGALAGILALAVSAIGFIGKLFMEAIEEISMKQIEAVRATGASFMSVIIFGVLPQVFPRLVGFCSYQLDANLRNSTMIGIVGAGGIGSVLFNAYQRFEYDFVLAILITIIALVLAGELLSTLVKRIFDV